MRGVVVAYRGAMSKPAWFDLREEADAFADWVRTYFRYDSVTVIGTDR